MASWTTWFYLRQPGVSPARPIPNGGTLLNLTLFPISIKGGLLTTREGCVGSEMVSASDLAQHLVHGHVQ